MARTKQSDLKRVVLLAVPLLAAIVLTCNAAVVALSPATVPHLQGREFSLSAVPIAFLGPSPNGPNSLDSASLSGAPPYAFDGAYARYNITVSGLLVHGYVYSTFVGYLVDSLDPSSGTFSVESNYGGEFSFLSSTVTASFDTPSPLPAVNAHDLGELNHGEVPVDMITPPNTAAYPPIAGVKSNMTVSVPAGTFIVDEVSLANDSTEWVAVHTGLIIRQTGAFSTSYLPAGLYGTLVLDSTNIPAGSQPPDYQLYVANATLVTLIALGIILGWRAGSRTRTSHQLADMKRADSS